MMIYLKRCLLAGLMIAGLCLMAGLNPAWSEAPSTEPLVQVDKYAITVAEFKAEMARRTHQLTSPEQMEGLLNEMVLFEMIYVAALRSGYDKDAQILARFKRMIVNKYREDVLLPRFEKLTVSEEEIKDYYKKHKADFVTSKRVRAAVIQINVPALASEEKKAQLWKRAKAARIEALKLTQATRSFGPVAVKYSDHQPTRYRGGDTGWLEVGRGNNSWPQEVMEAISSLYKTGEMSPVIKTSSGYYLAKLMETSESEPHPFVKVKERIRHQLVTEKKAQAEGEFYEELKTTVPVRVDRTLLGAIEPHNGSTDKEAKQPPGLPGQ
jgi:peptidyl-prolyl cis-trans isomerase C